MHIKHAVVRPPGISFAKGITNANLGSPNLELALAQHKAYCSALEKCGVSLVKMPPDDEFPDSTFVEDTALLTRHCGIITNPGAPSRRGEVNAINQVISRFYTNTHTIQPPGTLDGGDVCQTEDHFFIGISSRTNLEGAQQLASILRSYGFRTSLIDLRHSAKLLHLKSGLAYLGDNRLVLTDDMASHDKFEDYETILVTPGESYAANCLRVNEYVLVPAGFPKTATDLSKSGYQVQEIDVSEFQKMDGGLSCLSLRF